jgi:hypothetical protein
MKPNTHLGIESRSIVVKLCIFPLVHLQVLSSGIKRTLSFAFAKELHDLDSWVRKR